MAATSILCVTSDAEVLASCRDCATRMGWRCDAAGSYREAAQALEASRFDALLVQIDGEDGELSASLMSALRSEDRPPVIAVSKEGSIRDAVRAIRAGATDYLPLSSEDRLAPARILHQALQHTRGNDSPPHAPLPGMPFDGFATVDHPTLRVCQTLAAIVDSTSAILVAGESGTGKTLLARKLHECSARHSFAFVEMNCGGLHPDDVERELLGMPASGVGPRATGYRPGKFELANGGTLLVKGTRTIPPSLMARLLQGVEVGYMEVPDERGCIRSDVRLVVEINTALEDACIDSALREYPFQNGHCVRVHLLPLRERIADIPLLARHFVRLFSRKHGRMIRGIHSSALGRFVRYWWPGNVRELENAVEYSVILAQEEWIRVVDLPQGIRTPPAQAGRRGFARASVPLKVALREPERKHILQALRASRWNKHRAAKKLRISRSTLYKKIREYGLESQPALG